ETFQLDQESRDKMKQMNKEIKPANYTKINHLSGVFVPQKALSREELYFANNFKTANVSKSFLIPNEDLSDDTTPSVAHKFLNEASSAHQELHKIVREENFPIVNQVDARLQNFKIQFLKEAAKFVEDFKSLAKEADDSLAKHKALELEIEHLQTELEHTKERFENCIIKKETEYAKLWNDWYKKCGECKYDKISYDKAYKDMQQKIKQLQAQLGDLKGKSTDTSCVSDTRNPLSQKLENENVELEFQVLNYARENAYLKTTYKNLFDSISVSRAQTKTIIASLQNELQSNIYKNAKLRTQLFKKVSDQKDNTQDTSKNTKFVKQPIVENLFKIGVDNTKTRRPQPRSNTKNDRVPSASKSSRSKNKGEEVEEHHRNLLLSKNKKHMLSACNNFMRDSQNVCSKVVCAMCLGHNLFSVGQFRDSDLEVAFRRNACFVRNLEGVDLLKGDRSTNLYTINLHKMAAASPICLMARASSTKSWLWHQQLSHLNFDTINDLARNDLVVLTVSTMEPKNVKEAMTDPAWIDSMKKSFFSLKDLMYGC
nr:retrovirus-related Pol polyprotein from transposon TNT 1-94 [Tanacetum cinerariifolium]